jgi:hypothetical protein
MNHRSMFFSLLALAVLMALPAWGIHVEFQDFIAQVGVRLGDGQGQMEFAPDQMIAGAVALPMVLARHGLRGVKEGEAVQVTFIRDRRFKLMHVPSGVSVEITYRPKK